MKKTVYYSTLQGKKFFDLIVSLDIAFKKLFKLVQIGALSHKDYQLLFHGWETSLENYDNFLADLPMPDAQNRDDDHLFSKKALKDSRYTGTKKTIFFSSGLGENLFHSFIYTENFFALLNQLFRSSRITPEDFLKINEKFKEQYDALKLASANLKKLEKKLTPKR